ncbi:contact-dependent growth inhibition system immunity protein [Niabella sp.]|uniref:contact-dependent growth inhibition system immunity protein n=1 Tax=Niabella sp. TaxID=1962976 RepID=UPI0026065C98|nr:contact-dependent growth inhibition system immunity protein [Niabella sp.]
MDTNKSIEELEGEVWKKRGFPTDLVKRSFELRKVPVNNLDIDDLRLLIGQQIGLKYIVPMALNVLSNDILAEGNYYPGDLLKSVLEIPMDFWASNQLELAELSSIVGKNVLVIKNSNDIDDAIKAMLFREIATLGIEVDLSSSASL